MTLPEIATAYARIDKVWRSATRQSKKIHLVQLAQLDTAAAAAWTCGSLRCGIWSAGSGCCEGGSQLSTR